jgi:hypothetical protein
MVVLSIYETGKSGKISIDFRNQSIESQGYSKYMEGLANWFVIAIIVILLIINS